MTLYELQLYNNFINDILPQKKLRNVFLLCDDYEYSDDVGIFVLGKSEYYTSNVENWCTELSQHRNLSVKHIPSNFTQDINGYSSNEDFIPHLYYILQSKNIKAVIINCQRYKCFTGIKQTEKIMTRRCTFFKDNTKHYTDIIEAFFHYLKTCIIFIKLCDYYNVKLVLIDTDRTHTGVLWSFFRFVFLPRNKNTLVITGKGVCDKFLLKVVKFLKK